LPATKRGGPGGGPGAGSEKEVADARGCLVFRQEVQGPDSGARGGEGKPLRRMWIEGKGGITAWGKSQNYNSPEFPGPPRQKNWATTAANCSFRLDLTFVG